MLKLRKKNLYLLIGVTLLIITLLSAGATYLIISESDPVETIKQIVWSDNVPTDQVLERDRVFIVPSATTSAGVKSNYVNLVDSYAVSKSVIKISNCMPDERVISIKEGEKLEFRNNDKSKHVIRFGSRQNLSLDSKSTTSLTADFGKGTGVYMYWCDGNKTPAGIIRII